MFNLVVQSIRFSNTTFRGAPLCGTAGTAGCAPPGFLRIGFLDNSCASFQRRTTAVHNHIRPRADRVDEVCASSRIYSRISGRNHTVWT